MSFNHLFTRSLGPAPQRLHMAAHSHHLWPDASFAGQVECWEDAAGLADRKWDRVMGELWPEAQAEVAAELGTGQPDAIVFAGNTHDFIVRLWAAAPRRTGGPLRVLTTSGEFHSARRQFARWAESGDIALEVLPPEPHATLAQRLAERAREADLVMVSQLMFGTGRLVPGLDSLAAVAAPHGPWVVIDGYHSFMAVPEPLGALGTSCFFLAGGYKYAMSGEGLGLMHCPPGFGLRPPITGWYAEFEDLTLPPGQVGYAPDAMRFMGATFAVAELLDPPTGPARFLALRHHKAAEWQAGLLARDCITDVRGDVLRIGLGLYHDEDDLERFAELARGLG
jgi:selenocysteine lyase/cysteine desulfurase